MNHSWSVSNFVPGSRQENTTGRYNHSEAICKLYSVLSNELRSVEDSKNWLQLQMFSGAMDWSKSIVNMSLNLSFPHKVGLLLTAFVVDVGWTIQDWHEKGVYVTNSRRQLQILWEPEY